MGIIYIGIAVLVAGLISWLFIRTQRKKLAAERAQKVKVAEGIFEDAEDADTKRKKKKRKKRPLLHFSQLPELPEWLEEDIIKQLPKLVDEYLKAKRAAFDAITAVAKAEKAYKDAVWHSGFTKLPKIGSDNQSFVGTFTHQQLNVLTLARAAKAARLAMEDALRAKSHASSKIADFQKELSKYDCILIDEDAERILDIVRHVYSFNDGVDGYRGDVELPKALNEEPTAPNAEAQALVEQLSQAVVDLINAYSDTAQAEALAASARDEHSKATQPPTLTVPQKPVEQEVGAWMQSAQQWADSVHHAQEGLEATLTPLWDAISVCEQRAADVLNLLAKLNSMIDGAAQAQREGERQHRLGWSATPFDVDSPKVTDTPTDKDAADGTVTADGGEVKEESKPATADSPMDVQRRHDAGFRRTLIWGDAESSEGKPDQQKEAAFRSGARNRGGWRNRRDDFPAFKPVNFLTDAQESVRQAAIQLKDKVLNPFLETVKKWPKPAQLFLEGELSETDGELLSASRAAVRKLGYAIAQRNAAQVKLVNAQAEQLPDVDSSESTLEEPNVETFIRAHRRHRNDVQRREQLSTERSGRVSAVSNQLNERKGHVTQAVASINEVSTAITKDRKVYPKSLDAMVKVGHIVCQSANSTGAA